MLFKKPNPIKKTAKPQAAQYPKNATPTPPENNDLIKQMVTAPQTPKTKKIVPKKSVRKMAPLKESPAPNVFGDGGMMGQVFSKMKKGK